MINRIEKIKTKELLSLFKTAIDIYCDAIDHLKISKIFYPYEYYNEEELRTIYNFEDNKELIAHAKKTFYDYYRQDYIFLQNNMTDNNVIEEFNNYLLNKDYETDKTSMYSILKLAFIIAFYQKTKQNYDRKENIIKDYKELEENNTYSYYRGQTNYEYRISPSIIRNFNNNIYLDDDYYYKILTDEGLEDKYNRLIKRKNINKYEKYAFLQHSCSFSPFVDFTESIIASTSFALSNSGDINAFRNEDSAIFCLRHIEDETDIIEDKHMARSFLVNDFNLKIINSKYFKLGQEYILNKADNTQRIIKYYSIHELIDNLTPKIKILKIPTNDRMLYQRGLFICFYDCICLKDFIAYELSPKFSFVKLKIPKRNKRKLLNDIYKNNREFDPEHLMNPYLVFKE